VEEFQRFHLLVVPGVYVPYVHFDLKRNTLVGAKKKCSASLQSPINNTVSPYLHRPPQSSLTEDLRTIPRYSDALVKNQAPIVTPYSIACPRCGPRFSALFSSLQCFSIFPRCFSRHLTGHQTLRFDLIPVTWPRFARTNCTCLRSTTCLACFGEISASEASHGAAKEWRSRLTAHQNAGKLLVSAFVPLLPVRKRERKRGQGALARVMPEGKVS
jgi:hypothetical protein